MYVDGSEVNADSLPGNFADWGGSGYYFTLAGAVPGGSNWIGAFYYTGIYNRALSSSEVSHNYSLGIASDVLPFIADQPKDAFSIEGETASFSVKAASSTSLSYRWQKNGINIVGATSSEYTTDTLASSDNNSKYSVIVTNSSGSVTSDTVTLKVTPKNQRVNFGLQALYDFTELSGTTVHDVSGVGSPLDLTINTPGVTLWTRYTLKTTGSASVSTGAAATKLYTALTGANELTLEVWLKPADVNEDARIITISQNTNNLNFSLTQNGNDYEGILRTSETGAAGTSVIAPNVAKLELTHVVFTRSSDGTVKIFVDGGQKASGKINGDFSTWTSSYMLAFFNELTNDQPWLGNLNLVAFFNRALSAQEVAHNFEYGANVPFVVAPTNLTAQNVKSKTIMLKWKDNSPDEEGFVIERKMNGSVDTLFSVIDTTAANDTSYTDMNLNDTTTYIYRVQALGWLSSSAYSNEASIKTLLSTISAPTNLEAVKDHPDTNNVKLSWSDNSSNELGFVIQRKLGDTASVAAYANIDTVGENVVTFTDSTASDTTKYTYRIYAYNADTVSAYSNAFTYTTPLPVELTSFSANLVNSKMVVTWQTATEINNAGFSIERSTDNKKFLEVAFIKGKGTSTEKVFYSYTDKSALSGKYYYRLKQVDFNGSYNYSKSIEADLGLPTTYALDQNYPNPFNPSTTIRFALPMDAKVNIKLYNTLGQEVANIFNSELNAGVHETMFNASNLSSGVYFYRLEARGVDGSNFVSTKRMLLLK